MLPAVGVAHPETRPFGLSNTDTLKVEIGMFFGFGPEPIDGFWADSDGANKASIIPESPWLNCFLTGFRNVPPRFLYASRPPLLRRHSAVTPSHLHRLSAVRHPQHALSPPTNPSSISVSGSIWSDLISCQHVTSRLVNLLNALSMSDFVCDRRGWDDLQSIIDLTPDTQRAADWSARDQS
ncbi:hypothetical protein LA080_007839 [Diaporthe eres]|nr:hypothetical protein LA080_007839 [Diaporthe eres]